MHKWIKVIIQQSLPRFSQAHTHARPHTLTRTVTHTHVEAHNVHTHARVQTDFESDTERAALRQQLIEKDVCNRHEKVKRKRERDKEGETHWGVGSGRIWEGLFKRGSRLDVADRQGGEFHCAGPGTDLKYLLANRFCSKPGYIGYFLCLQQTDRWGPLRPLSPRNPHTVYRGFIEKGKSDWWLHI